MRILSLDFETTYTSPVDPKKCRITEVGAVLYCTQRQKPLKIMSDLVWASDYPESPPELVEITGIDDEMLKEFGEHPSTVLNDLTQLMWMADYVVAHNGTFFDRPLYLAECSRFLQAPCMKSWIDSRTDIPFGKSIKTRSLSFLAPEHGFLNPFKHRALFDALTTLKILSMYDLEEVVRLSKEPLVYAIAKVTFDQKHLAKDAGYYWDGDNKRWYKPMKECYLKQEQEIHPFVVETFYPVEE